MKRADIDPDFLAPADRKEFKVAISRRRDTMLTGLDDQLAGNVDQIIAQLREVNEITLTEEQLSDLIEGCDEQIRGELQKHLADEKRRVQVSIEEANDSLDQQEREMKARHKMEWEGLKKMREAKIEELRNQLRTAEERVAREHTAEILDKKKEYQRKKVQVKEMETKIAAEAQSRVLMIQRNKGKLINLINDGANRSLEELITITSRKRAIELLNQVPTVAEAVELCSTADGIMDLFKRLDPNQKALPDLSGTTINDNDRRKITSTIRGGNVIDVIDIPRETSVGEDIGEASIVDELEIPEPDRDMHDVDVYSGR